VFLPSGLMTSLRFRQGGKETYNFVAAERRKKKEKKKEREMQHKLGEIGKDQGTSLSYLVDQT